MVADAWKCRGRGRRCCDSAMADAVACAAAPTMPWWRPRTLKPFLDCSIGHRYTPNKKRGGEGKYTRYFFSKMTKQHMELFLSETIGASVRAFSLYIVNEIRPNLLLISNGSKKSFRPISSELNVCHSKKVKLPYRASHCDAGVEANTPRGFVTRIRLVLLKKLRKDYRDYSTLLNHNDGYSCFN